MAHGDANAARRGVGGQFRRAVQLGRQRHQPHPALGGLEEPVEDGQIRREQILRRLHAALPVRKKRPFEMNA